MHTFTTINTIRHAETEYNREKRYAGTIDISLSELGKRDALEASKELRGIKFDVVITSTLKRTIETAQLLVDGNIPLIQNKLCNERNYGMMQGLTENEVKLIKPKILYINVGDDYHSVNPAKGESFELLRERVKKFHRFIFRNYMESNVLVVSHGVFLQQFHGLIRGKCLIESLAIEVPNLVLTSFRFKGFRKIEEMSTGLIDREQMNW